MQSMEWMLVFTALVASLLLLLQPVSLHDQKMGEQMKSAKARNDGLACSVLFEESVTHYVRNPADECMTYPYAFLPEPSPFDLYLGIGGRHYD